MRQPKIRSVSYQVTKISLVIYLNSFLNLNITEKQLKKKLNKFSKKKTQKHEFSTKKQPENKHNFSKTTRK